MRHPITLCALALLFAACGGDAQPEATDSGSTKEATKAPLHVEYYVISER